MSDTFDQHVPDHQRIEKNAEMILLSALCRVESTPADIKPFGSIPYRVSEQIQPKNIYFIPSTDALLRIHKRDPLEDLRRYFGCIKNVTVE